MERKRKTGLLTMLLGGTLATAFADPKSWGMTDTFVGSFLAGETHEIVDLIGSSPVPGLMIGGVLVLGVLLSRKPRAVGILGIAVSVVLCLGAGYYWSWWGSHMSMAPPAKLYVILVGYVLAGAGGFALLSAEASVPLGPVERREA